MAAFKSGYSGTIDAYLELAAVPQMNTPREKNAVCEKFGQANEELKNAIGNFTSAKASSTASSEHGFTIGMVLERAGPIQLNAEDAQISCMKAVLADREGDSGAFEKNLAATGENIREMKRIYPELEVLNSDFS